MRPKTYEDWLQQAADSGIDWGKDLPPPEMLTEELCMAALEDAPEHLGKMPESVKTPDVCFAAVYIDDEALRFVPAPLRESVKARKDAITEEEWLADLSTYTGNHYLKLPRHLLTPDFCEKMVSANGNTICLIPKEQVTPRLQELAASQDRDRWLKNRLSGTGGNNA
jgi:hypothetical protein